MATKSAIEQQAVKAKDLPARDGRDVTGGLLTTFLAKVKQAFNEKPPTGGGSCPEWQCTTNHNETLLRG